MDMRLRCAVDASVGWYEDLCALHGVGSVLTDGLWSSIEAPPALHSDAVVVEPSVTAALVRGRLDGREHCGFKDSFAEVDLSGDGMDLLFSASWLYRAPPDSQGVSRLTARRSTAAAASRAAAGGAVPNPGWSVVGTSAELAEWTGTHDTAGVLLPALLQRGHFKILAMRGEQGMVAGAVARLGSGVVDVSNVHATPGYSVDWGELVTVVQEYFPGRALVGYERGDDLAAAVAGGFVPVGDLRVWVR